MCKTLVGRLEATVSVNCGEGASNIVMKLSCVGSLGCCMTLVGVLGCQPATPRTQDTRASQVSPTTVSPKAIQPTVTEPKPVTTLTIAAATNLKSVLPVLAADFTQNHPEIRLHIHYEASVDLYDKIVGNKQKFDIYLAGNQVFPKLIYQQGHTAKAAQSAYSKPFTYTRGQLILLSTKHPLEATPTSTLDNFILDHNGQITLAIANPQVATYGSAAESWLINQNLYQSLESNLVYQKSIEDVFNATDNGKVDFGLTALSQALAKPNTNQLSTINQDINYAILPKDSYPPILQDGVVMNQSAASDQFIDYLLTTRAQDVFSDAGYLPICTKSNLLPGCK